MPTPYPIYIQYPIDKERDMGTGEIIRQSGSMPATTQVEQTPTDVLEALQRLITAELTERRRLKMLMEENENEWRKSRGLPQRSNP